MTAKKAVLYDRYRISKAGIITERGKKIEHVMDGDGIYIVYLYLPDGRRVKRYVHRLLAESFLPNPKRKTSVIFKNYDKTDYRLRNLKWVTKAESNKHYLGAGGRKAKALRETKRIPAHNPLHGDMRLAVNLPWISA